MRSFPTSGSDSVRAAMSRAERASVFVADDHPVFLEAVAQAIRTRPELELAGQAGDGRQALVAMQRSWPTIAILDQQLPSLSGLDVLRALQRDQAPTRVMLLCSDDSSALVYEAIQAGAAGFLTKASTLAAICDAVAIIARGGLVLAPEVQMGLAEQVRSRGVDDRPVLSPREAQVLRLIADGQSAPQIGATLFISPSTVKTHIKSVFEKLEVNDRAAAVAEGMRRGLLE